MDTENKAIDADNTPSKRETRSATSAKRMSVSPRKRAFREVNAGPDASEEEENPKWRQGEEAAEEPQRIKRMKLQRTQDEYPEPFAAHVLWSLDPECDTTAMLLEDKHCYIGTSGTKDRRVIQCDLDGHVISQQNLRYPVGELFRHGKRLYAWCRALKGFDTWKGMLVDMSFETPQTLFEIRKFGNILTHAAMVDGCLVLADNSKGAVGVFGCDGQPVWKREEQLGHGNFFHADESGVYYAHKKIVRSYSVDSGEIQWEYVCSDGRGGSISGGHMDGDHLYIESRGRITQLERATGAVAREYVPYRHQAEGVLAGNGRIVTGNNPTVIFDQETQRETHRMYVPARVDQSMAEFSSSGRLYLLWDRMYCVNLTDEGLSAASEGTYARTYTYKAPQITDAPITSDVTHDTHDWLGTLTNTKTGGVIVQCSSPEKDADPIKTYVKSDGYEADWPVMIPRDLKKAGQRYVVDGLVASALGKFYSVTGSIAKYFPELEAKTAPLAVDEVSSVDSDSD